MANGTNWWTLVPQWMKVGVVVVSGVVTLTFAYANDKARLDSTAAKCDSNATQIKDNTQMLQSIKMTQDSSLMEQRHFQKDTSKEFEDIKKEQQEHKDLLKEVLEEIRKRNGG